MSCSTPPLNAPVHTWILNAEHSIATWVNPDAMVPYVASCKCGWHAASTSPGLRNWNADGHAQDVMRGGDA